MFGNLKTKNTQKSVFKNSAPMRHSFSKSPSVSSSVTKTNEGDRLVRCRICGFICDRERDISIDDGKFAGLGVQLGTQKTAGSSIGDSKAPAAGSVSGTADRYYDRDVKGGCPACGAFTYDPDKPITQIPPLQ